MRTVTEMCQNCYGTHLSAAEQLRCDQAQAQRDAEPPPVGRGKRYADACKWCGSVHATKAERAQCMLDNCG